MLKTNRERRLASQVAASIAILSLSCPAAFGAGAGWYTNYDEAVRAARREGKPIFADFSTEWCPSCRLLEKNTLTDPAIVQRLDSFVKVHIDAEKQKNVADRYQVKAYPTVVTMDPSGNMVNTAVGYMKPRELASTLDSSMMAVGPSLQQQRNDTAKKTEKEAKEKELAEAKEKQAEAKAKDQADAKAKAKKAELADDDEPAGKTARAVAEAQAEARRVAKGGGNQMVMSQGGERKLPASSVIEPVSEELPRPFLNRAGGEVPAISTPVLAAAAKSKSADTPAKKTEEPKKAEEPKAAVKTELPAAASASRKPDAASDPMAAVRLLQAAAKSDDGKPAAKSDAAALAPDTKVVAMNAAPKATETVATKPAAAVAAVSTTADTAKAPTGATREELEGYFKDANDKLVSGKKKEARALYEHVVDKDPENQHGKSDIAFVRMVSLIVDKDDDLLRRKAYNRICEFEARFPDSKHKDYYTLIRATLAADLNETNHAHVLLDNFTQRFPDSKYQKKAYDTWKSLPPVKKEKESAKSKDSASEKPSRT